MKIAERNGWAVFRAPFNGNTEGKRQLVFHRVDREEMWTLFIGNGVYSEDPGVFSPMYEQERVRWHRAGDDDWADPPPELLALFRTEIDGFLAQQRLSGAWNPEKRPIDTETIPEP